MKADLSFDFIKSSDICFKVSTCTVNGFPLEGVIFSPNYDLLIYFINSNLLKDELLSFEISIEVLATSKNNKKYSYLLCSTFSKERYFSRFSGLFDRTTDGQILVQVSFHLKNEANIKNIQNKANTKKIQKKSEYLTKKFNVISLDKIEADKIYYENKLFDIKDKQILISEYKAANNFYISFYGTEEIIGPIKSELLEQSLITKYYTSIFLIPNEIANGSNKLAFVVETNSENSEFFGVFPLSEIQNIFSEVYTITVNNQQFDKNLNYPSGIIVYLWPKND